MGEKDLDVAALRLKLRAADEMARVCDQWVQSGVIDARSALADARLRYGTPFIYDFDGVGSNVPPEHRAKSPALLRELAAGTQFAAGSNGQKILLDAAAEIEGGEAAYADLVEENKVLRDKIKRFERNLL